MVYKVLSIASMTGFGMLLLGSGLVFGSMFMTNSLNKGGGKGYGNEYFLGKLRAAQIYQKNGDLSTACNV